MNLLVVDNFDSFTYMLVDYLQQAGAACRVVRNNESWERLTEGSVDAVVLSPGPGSPYQSGSLMNIIHYYHRRVPMLGVCLGHQAIGQYFGAELIPGQRPMHGKVSTIRTITEDVLWQDLPETFDVTRYHSLVLTNMPDALITTAITDQDEVMAMRHDELPIWGIQFHPEAALTQYGLQLIKNWTDYITVNHRKTDFITPLTSQYNELHY
ncbi:MULTISPECIES: aminodeoxychorismate/anthranilate synthase component II [unclassified Spirosoma]|uniref:anthranilate synthase component II n=1 Tax=unclassified Spirosoma TaxID=2621999 RepID=UPI0009653EA6|nr:MULTISPECIES: aminodeoxychorismate/anthranilate synthase component II [unclassified Spirosoma]MBN8825355.1 aminodeoxychorismate/anthranilate synthase component II [Spirosoma sp.]OJW77475.1 MAG: aminodeoxychorismate/anthranilate synthase component II [Spirosoma sp. 48-14]